MRALVGLIAVVLLLAVCGWITFSWNGNRASVNVETERVEEDTQHIVSEGRELLEGVSEDVPEEPVGDRVPVVEEPVAEEPIADDTPAAATATDELERRD